MKLNLSDGVKIRKYNEIKKLRKELCMSYIYEQKYIYIRTEDEKIKRKVKGGRERGERKRKKKEKKRKNLFQNYDPYFSKLTSTHEVQSFSCM